MKTVLTFNLNTKGLNGSEGLIRGDRWKRKKLLDMIQWLILEQSPGRHKGQVKITYTRISKGSLDWDNLGSSLKLWQDALVRTKVIKDDSVKVIPEDPVKIQLKGSPGTIIEIEDLD